MRPTPRAVVTTRTPSVTRTGANSNSRVRQVANNNPRNPQVGGNNLTKTPPPKLTPQKQAAVQARLGKLRVGVGQRGALSSEFKGPAGGAASSGGNGKPPGGNGTGANDNGTGTGDKPPGSTPVKKDDRPVFRPNGPKPKP